MWILCVRSVVFFFLMFPDSPSATPLFSSAASGGYKRQTQDHLDYHGSMQAYWESKRRLFDWAGLQSAVINIDDERGAALAQELRAQDRGLDVWTVSTQGAARLQATDIALTAQGLQCRIL